MARVVKPAELLQQTHKPTVVAPAAVPAVNQLPLPAAGTAVLTTLANEGPAVRLTPEVDPLTAPDFQARLKEAEHNAHASGLARGLEEGQRKLAEQGQQLSQLVQNIPAELAKAQTRLEARALDIAMAATVRILGEQATDRPQMLAVIKASLASTRAERITCLHLSPADYDYLVAIDKTLGDSRVLRVVASKDVTPGGCLIETPGGSVDTRFETQLGRMRQVLETGLHEVDHG